MLVCLMKKWNNDEMKVITCGFVKLNILWQANSRHETAPSWGFGTSNREDADKVCLCYFLILVLFLKRNNFM